MEMVASHRQPHPIGDLDMLAKALVQTALICLNLRYLRVYRVNRVAISVQCPYADLDPC